MRVAVFDYGAGNVFSAREALRRLGAEATITADPVELERANAVLVPGVGAFGYVYDRFCERGGPAWFERAMRLEQPVLGVCVGMQILFEESSENGIHHGLGELSGSVRRLPATPLPHVGWQRVDPPLKSAMFSSGEDHYYYFVHSYARTLDSPIARRRDAVKSVEVSSAVYGTRFAATVESHNLWATQFHPEKSGEAGLLLLENWLAIATN